MALDKIKQLNELRKMRGEAQKMQKELEKIKETVQDSGGGHDYQVTVTGDQKIASIKIDDEEQEALVKTINDAMKKVQKKAAQKMMEMGGGLSGLLGG
jgi:DNA-binding protein YbaB